MQELLLLGKGTEWLWAALQFVVVVVTAILIYAQIKTQVHTHVVRTIEDMMRLWNSSHYLLLRRQVCDRWREGEEAFDPMCGELCEIFERFGLYLRIGAIPEQAMWEAISWHIEHYYSMFGDKLCCVRRKYNDLYLFENFEILARRMIKISRKRGISNFSKTQEEIRVFLDGEVSTANILLRLESEKQSQIGRM